MAAGRATSVGVLLLPALLLLLMPATSVADDSQGVAEWLEALNLANWASNFKAEGFNTLGELNEAELTTGDLEELGIESPAKEAIMAALNPSVPPKKHDLAKSC